MVTLIALRHAKSSWALPGVDDFDRPLNDRGVRDAPLIGQWLAENNLTPDLVLCSSAARTQETYQRVNNTLKSTASLEIVDALYLPSPDTIRSALRAKGADNSVVLVLSHNPGLHEAVLALLSEADRAGAGSLRSHFPTCGCAVITFPFDRWDKINWNSGELSSYIVPKALLNEPTGN